MKEKPYLLLADNFSWKRILIYLPFIIVCSLALIFYRQLLEEIPIPAFLMCVFFCLWILIICLQGALYRNLVFVDTAKKRILVRRYVFSTTYTSYQASQFSQLQVKSKRIVNMSLGEGAGLNHDIGKNTVDCVRLELSFSDSQSEHKGKTLEINELRIDVTSDADKKYLSSEVERIFNVLASVNTKLELIKVVG